MALIGTMREKMGTLVVVFVFVAIAAFILGDLLGNNSVLFNDDKVGEIAGTTITLEEFQRVIDEREANYYLNFGRRPGDREMISLRQQAWDLLVLRHAFQEQFDALGVRVTADEVKDMLYGTNVDENLKQTPLFQDPATGQFDRAKVKQYMSQLAEPPAGANDQMLAMYQEQLTRWNMFQNDLAPGRQRIKYENLLLKSNYITSAEAEREYHNQTDVAEVRYLYVPYYTLSDTVVDVKDSDLEAYYNKNKSRFKTQHTKDLKYVSFPLVPSSDDTLAVVEDMQKIANELKQIQDDSAYAVTNTDGQSGFASYDAGSLPEFIKPGDLKAGNVVGPFLDGQTYKVVKISRSSQDTVFAARASHILIKWDNETDAAKKAAREKARGILKDIRNGASFAAKAREHGTDGSASRGGDLGWFYSGTDPNRVHMVKPFEKAVFDAKKTGVLNDVVETEFGYHIIDVTNLKDNTRYHVAVVERQITPSDATTNATYRKAENFAIDLDGEDEFVQRARESGIVVHEAKGLTAGERRIDNLGDARQIIQWLFRDAKDDEVSEVFDLQGEYAVAVMTGETEEGYRSLEDVKAEITPNVIKEVKGRMIIEKLKDQTGTLDEMAVTYGNDAAVYSSSDLKLNASTLPSVGFDPRAVGLAFSLENGKRSEPHAGESGVVVMELQNKTTAPSLEDYSAYELPIQQTLQSRSSFQISEAIKENAGIVDQRYKFY